MSYLGHTVSLEATSLLLHLNISNPEHMLLANHVIDELIKMNNVMFEVRLINYRIYLGMTCILSFLGETWYNLVFTFQTKM